MRKYKTFNHAKTKIRFHIIFSTKYRKNCLTEIKENLLDTLKIAVSKADGQFKIEACEIDKNHIHLLVSTSPAYSISGVVKCLKQHTTYWLWNNQYSRDHLKKFYYGKKHHLWTRGYFCSTIGEVSEEKLRDYIENQG
jgi:putative transposase